MDPIKEAKKVLDGVKEKLTGHGTDSQPAKPPTAEEFLFYTNDIKQDATLNPQRKAFMKALAARAASLKLAPGAVDPIIISDARTEDKDGTLQWTELVMAGGGMLGIATVGFVYVLEEAGVRFLGLGGTSAGAINSCLMAALREKSLTDKTWKKTLEILATCNFSDFEDGDGTGKPGDNFWVKLRKQLVSLIADKKAPDPAAVVDGTVTLAKNKDVVAHLWGDMGMHCGKVFFKWMAGHLKNAGIETVPALKERMKIKGVTIKNTDGRDITKELGDARPEPLKMIASEIVTQTKIVFPEDANLFVNNGTITEVAEGTPKPINPAFFVRTSMSVPIFFYAVQLNNLPLEKAGWERKGYTGPIPNKAVFVDGGMLSNFPIDLFHDHSQVPVTPTLGVLLSPDRSEPQEVGNLLQMYSAMNTSSRKLHDREYILHNPDFKQLIQYINTKGFNWLDFTMDKETQRALFRRGVVAGIQFLETWRKNKGKWEKYKALRRSMIQKVPFAVEATNPAVLDLATRTKALETAKAALQDYARDDSAANYEALWKALMATEKTLEDVAIYLEPPTVKKSTGSS